MGDEVVEAGAVAGGEAGSGLRGGTGDDGDDARPTQASGGVEVTCGLVCLIFVEMMAWRKAGMAVTKVSPEPPGPKR